MHRPRLLPAMAAALALLLHLASCEEEDVKEYPPAVTELVEATTNGQKTATRVVLDDGTAYDIENTHFSAERPDTTYRCLCVYRLKTETTIEVYQLGLIPSSKPHPKDKFKKEGHDPVKIESVWNSPRYINASIGMLTTGAATHKMAFSEDSATVSPQGVRTTHISLHHEKPENDAESYTSTIYLSLPTYFYEGTADSIDFAIFTYDGIRHFGKRM